MVQKGGRVGKYRLLALCDCSTIATMLTRRVHAIEFADLLTKQLASSEWRDILRANPEAEHKALAGPISDLLKAFLEQRKLPAAESLFDWEGNAARTWPQSHSYELLGTSAHPDAAVLRPFTCAFEFDRQAVNRGASYLKERLMKAACHVLTGAYDAAVFVYVLQRAGESSENYLSASNPFNRRLLDSFRLHGLSIAVIEAG